MTLKRGTASLLLRHAVKPDVTSGSRRSRRGRFAPGAHRFWPRVERVEAIVDGFGCVDVQTAYVYDLGKRPLGWLKTETSAPNPSRRCSLSSYAFSDRRGEQCAGLPCWSQLNPPLRKTVAVSSDCARWSAPEIFHQTRCLLRIRDLQRRQNWLTGAKVP